MLTECELAALAVPTELLYLFGVFPCSRNFAHAEGLKYKISQLFSSLGPWHVPALWHIHLHLVTMQRKLQPVCSALASQQKSASRRKCPWEHHHPLFRFADAVASSRPRLALHPHTLSTQIALAGVVTGSCSNSRSKSSVLQPFMRGLPKIGDPDIVP